MNERTSESSVMEGRRYLVVGERSEGIDDLVFVIVILVLVDHELSEFLKAQLSVSINIKFSPDLIHFSILKRYDSYNDKSFSRRR